jgi:hypothetical protein
LIYIDQKLALLLHQKRRRRVSKEEKKRGTGKAYGRQQEVVTRSDHYFFSYGKQSLEVSCFYSGPFFFLYPLGFYTIHKHLAAKRFIYLAPIAVLHKSPCLSTNYLLSALARLQVSQHYSIAFSQWQHKGTKGACQKLALPGTARALVWPGGFDSP